MLKTWGYLISGVSVVLLGIVAWDSASRHTLLLVCLIGGMTASMCGMLLRWLSHHRAERRNAVAQLARRSDPGRIRKEQRTTPLSLDFDLRRGAQVPGRCGRDRPEESL